MEKALVIIPTFNEAENIQKVIEASIKENSFDILVVDDSSPDGTATIVKEMIKLYPQKIFLEIRETKDSLGRAYVHGFKWAIKKKYDYIFEMDADFSHNPIELSKIKKLFKKRRGYGCGFSLCKGNQCCQLAFGSNFIVLLCLCICKGYHINANKRSYSRFRGI